MAKLQSESDIKYQLQLPTVSYRVITDDKSLLTPAGVHSVGPTSTACVGQQS